MHGFAQYFLHWIDLYGYAGLYAVMVLANIGAPVGSEVILPAAGALAATHHLQNIYVAIGVAVLAELTGQTIGYIVGRFGGRPFIDRYGKYVRLHHSAIEKAQSFFKRYGSFAVFICRFIPFIRGIVGIPAGFAAMALLPFYLWTAAGSLIFCGALIFAGSAAGHAVQHH